MPLQNINPTKTEAWSKLSSHFADFSDFTIQKAFKDNPNRKEEFSLRFSDLCVDFSKNRVSKETMNLLVDLANEVELKQAIKSYFGGEKIKP